MEDTRCDTEYNLRSKIKKEKQTSVCQDIT